VTALLSIYGITIMAATLLAMGLAVLGAHIATRDKAMQTMCIGQGAMLGVITGIGLSHALFHDSHVIGWLPLLIAGICSGLTFLLSERFLRHRHAAKNTVLVAMFTMLLSAGYLATTMFPGLENHLTQRYFGDLATMSQTQSTIALIVAALLLIILAISARPMLRDTFNGAILGRLAGLSPKRRSSLLFNLLVVGMTAASVQVAGFLFTTMALFLPTTCISFSRRAGASRHLRLCMAVAGVGTSAGFTFALYASRLPTVPTIAVAVAVAGIAAALR
jgi:ABC-type Mn2+/Zn2+ transport system permease subunit